MKVKLAFLLLFGLSVVFCDSCFASIDTRKLAQGSHDVYLPDAHIHYVVKGHGPLLLITSPGQGISSLYLQKGLAPLGLQFTCVYVDVSESAGARGAASRHQINAKAMADDIDHLRDYLDLQSIDLVGHLHGNEIALDYAERHPSRLRKLVLLDLPRHDDRAKDVDEAMTLELSSTDPRHFIWTEQPTRLFAEVSQFLSR